MEGERLDLVYRVLDLQLVDVDGRRCGKVDDVELSGEPLRATALLSGTGTFPDRLPRRLLPRLARRLLGRFVLGGNVVRIPWEDIDEIGATVRLRRKAVDLGLGQGDDELAPVIGRLLLARPEGPSSCPTSNAVGWSTRPASESATCSTSHASCARTTSLRRSRRCWSAGRAWLAGSGSAAGGPKRCRPAMSSRFATARWSFDGGIDCS